MAWFGRNKKASVDDSMARALSTAEELDAAIRKYVKSNEELCDCIERSWNKHSCYFKGGGDDDGGQPVPAHVEYETHGNVVKLIRK